MIKGYPAGGVLFQNTKGGSRAPDFNGNIEIDLELFNEIRRQIEGGNDRAKLDLAAWRRRSQNGKDFLSLKPSKPYQKPEVPDQAPRRDGGRATIGDVFRENLDDDIPF